ncbi:MAG: hypothetical protein HYX74_06425 [Acidobacteria bacterium]|nr:hypothetical protein [Acidobacteriota bacterium]
MESEEVTRLKAEAFDRIVQIYRELEKQSAFGSSSWVILTEALEKELQRIEQQQ